MNGTMASFAAAHGRRRRAEGTGGHLQPLPGPALHQRLRRLLQTRQPGLRTPPGLLRRETLTSRPLIEFVHEEDRDDHPRGHRLLAGGAEVAEFENRYLRADGSERWLQWSARSVPEQGLIYAAARDVTESRRTSLGNRPPCAGSPPLVARGAPPSEVFGRVAEEVATLLDTAAAVLRYEPDDSHTALGIALAHQDALDEATPRRAARRPGRPSTRSPAPGAPPVRHPVGAPIVVEDRLWGFVVAVSPLEPLPEGTESRLADFTELVATAIANADSRAQLTASRARVVAAAAPPGGASSAICTTASSSASSPSNWICGSPRPW